MPFGDLRNNFGFSNTFGAGMPHARSCCCTACAEKTAPDAGDARDGGGFGGSRLIDDGSDTQQGASDTVAGSVATTFTIALGGTQTGRVNTGGDDDWYRVQLVAGQTYVFTLNGSGASALQDPYLELRDASGTLIAIDDDAGTGLGSLLRFTATDSGTYYINARAWEPSQGAPTLTGEYTLTMNTGAPQNPLDTIDFAYTFPDNTISVYFSVQGETYSGDTAVRNWTQTEINSVMSALGTISAVTPLVFTQVATAGQADFILTLANLGAGTLGHFFIGTGHGGFNPSASSWTTAGLQPGGAGWVTVVHEILHGLGLAHPHDNGGLNDNDSEIMQGVIDPFNSIGTYAMNQGVYTMMSYNDGWLTAPWGQGSTLSAGNQSTPMALDIALLQQRYGVNPTTNNGNTVYTLGDVDSSFAAIWDTGGADTIAYNGAGAANIDLRAATLLNEAGGAGWVSYVFNVDAGYTIANGVVIENAIGGSGNDTITGNAAANRFTGNAGADVMIGGAGIDTSVYNIASTSATWTRNPDGSWTVSAGAEGADTVSSVEFLDFSDRDVFLDMAETNFSGDGTSDILLRRTADGITAIWSMNGASVANATPTLWQAGNEWSLQHVGDFNFDGRDDFLLRRVADGVTAIWSMNGPTVIAADVTLWQAGNEWQIQGVGDFNGDGGDDILWRRTSDGVTAIWQMNGTNVVAADVTLWQAGNEWQIQGIGDFNGDGRDDFLWRRSSDGVTAIWQMNGTNVVAADVTSQQAGLEWSLAGVGDFNGDGRDDILLRRGSDGVMAVWSMNGTTLANASALSQQAGVAWSVAAIGDYNGDGRDDLLLQNADTSLLAVWTLNGASVLSANLTSQQAGFDWGII
jgi:hypothetical protein